MKTNILGKVIVAYHSPCMDGYGAACAHYANSELLRDHVQYKGVSYGFLSSIPTMESFPWDDESITHIIFLDICPTRETLDFLTKVKGFRITIVDHHKTAKTILSGYDNQEVRYLIADNFSGASLTMALGKDIDKLAFGKDFKPSGEIDHYDPLMGGFLTNVDRSVFGLINRARITSLYGLLEVRDIWIEDDLEIKAKADHLAAYLKFRDISKEPICDINEMIKAHGGLEEILIVGKTIDEVQRSVVTDSIAASYKSKLTLRGNTQVELCIGVCPDGMGSMFGDMWNKSTEGDSLALALFHNLRANEIGVSLRSNNDLARKVAEELGGGGHDSAAGCAIRPVTKIGDLPSINAIIRKIESILIHM